MYPHRKIKIKAHDWILLGKQLCEVFDKYFNQINIK